MGAADLAVTGLPAVVSSVAEANLAAVPFQWAEQIRFDPDCHSELVEDVLLAGGMSVWYGDSGSGKTTIVGDLCYRIPSGESWLGRRVRVCPVVYVAAESPSSVVKRLTAYQKHHARAVGDFGLISCALNLLDPSVDVDTLIDLLKIKRFAIGRPIGLVVIDTLARSMPGANENASEDMSRPVAAADCIRRETGAHVAFIHHSGKNAALGARGHSSLRAAVDTEIEIADEGGGIHSLTVTKQRDLLKLSTRFRPIELGGNHWGNPITACVVEEMVPESSHLTAMKESALREHAEDAVLKSFRRLRDMGLAPTDARNAQGYLPRQAIEKNLGQGCSKEALADALNRLMARGVFRRGVIGKYGTNRTPREGLILASEVSE